MFLICKLIKRFPSSQLGFEPIPYLSALVSITLAIEQYKVIDDRASYQCIYTRSCGKYMLLKGLPLQLITSVSAYIILNTPNT